MTPPPTAGAPTTWTRRPTTPARNHQFVQSLLDRSTDQGMASQQPHRLLDQLDRFQRGHRIAGKQEIGQPLQIGKRLRRIDQPRQVLALGLTGLAPAMRAFRKA